MVDAFIPNAIPLLFEKTTVPVETELPAADIATPPPPPGATLAVMTPLLAPNVTPLLLLNVTVPEVMRLALAEIAPIPAAAPGCTEAVTTPPANPKVNPLLLENTIVPVFCELAPAEIAGPAVRTTCGLSSDTSLKSSAIGQACTIRPDIRVTRAAVRVQDADGRSADEIRL